MGREFVENVDSKVVDMSLHLMKVGVLSGMWITEFVSTFAIDHKYLNWKCTSITIEKVTYLVS